MVKESAMSTRNNQNRSTTHYSTDDVQVGDPDLRIHRQNRWLRFIYRQYKWIISICIVLALLALFAILIPSLLPARQAVRVGHSDQPTQTRPQPATAQPLAKNTENIIGLAQNILCVSDNAGNNIYGLQSDSGKLVWQYHESHATLETVDENQRLYLSEQDGTNASIRVLGLNNGTTLWQHAFPHVTLASLAAEDSALYATTQNNTLYVLGSSDGTLLWHYSFPPNTSYTQADGITLAYTEDGRSLWALQANNGKLLWHINEHTSSWPLTASAGITFLQTQDGYLKALNSQTGKQVWQSSIATVADNPVKVVGTTVYINTGDGNVKAARVRDGQTLWQYKPAQPILGEVTFNQSILYATGLDSAIYALDSSSGALLWKQNIQAITNQLVIAGTTMYVHTGGGSEYAINAITGSRLWSRNLAQTDIYRTIVLDNLHELYIMGADETLTALDSNSGSFLWKQPILNYPVFSGKNIYVNRGDGTIDALDSHAGTLVWYVPVTR
jgi:outer membrane protein assembly factor BamB